MMRIAKIAAILFVLLFVRHKSFGEHAKDHAVIIKVNLYKGNPNKVLLSWNGDMAAISYTVFRKLKNESVWTELATLQPNDNTFLDVGLQNKVGYEYYILKHTQNYDGYGYVYVGSELPFVDSRGTLLLLVDNTISDSLYRELDQFRVDLIGDGWNVIRIDVPRTEKFDPEAVTKIKNLIYYQWVNSNYNLKAVTLFGRIAVPYSGTDAYDGHFPQHYGAWPSDVFYGVMLDNWTDVTANTTSADRPENRNVPLDGKFDQTVIPDYATLEIGRVDFYNLPIFKETETELYRRYLNKDHNYRYKLFTVSDSAFIDDGFDMYTDDAFSSMAWMNFAALVGPDKIATDYIGSYLPHLTNSSYIWSYACNQGAYDNMLITLYADQCDKYPIHGVFTTYIGSYFGDWDSQNNLLRSAIASSPSVLECFWGGRPFWYIHRMGLGETIGEQALLVQNNEIVYVSSGNKATHCIHIALMGDPTLRMYMFAPPPNFHLTNQIDNGDGSIQYYFQWESSPDSVLGYELYYYNSSYNGFIKLNNAYITDTTWNCSLFKNLDSVFMLRAVRLEKTPTGSFYNKSQGVFIDLENFLSVPDNNITHSFSIYPNPAYDNINVYMNINGQSLVSLELVDLTGITVSHFINHKYITGNNVFNFKLTSDYGLQLHDGVYLLKASIDGNINSKKIIVIRNN